MATRGINLQPLIAAKVTTNELVDAVIVATDFQGLIASANSGDKTAAKELLALASAYLGSDIFGPMPPELRRYLAKAFVAISVDNKAPSADVALNLKKKAGGRPRNYHRNELRIGQWIRKRMEAGEKLEQASYELSEYIATGLRKYETFYGFRTIPGSKALEDIYTKVLPELADLEKFVTC